jgi:hypothetical protein
MWANAHIRERNLHTNGEFFPSKIHLFSILNMRSASIHSSAGAATPLQ